MRLVHGSMALANKETLVLLGRCKKCGTSVYEDWPHKCLEKKFRAPKRKKGKSQSFVCVDGRIVR